MNRNNYNNTKKDRGHISKLLPDNFISKLENLEIFTRNMPAVYFESGYQGYRKGGEVEFADHKPYSFGDDIRYIDWNAYARLDKYVTKLFGAEEKKRTNILLDTSSSMGCGNKFPFSVRIAAALSVIALFSGDIVDAGVFDVSLKRFCGEVSGRKHFSDLLAFFKRLDCGGATDMEKAIKEFVLQKRGPSRVILISDLWSDQNPLQYLNILRNAETETSVVHILGRNEISPAFKGSLLLQEPESSTEIMLEISDRELTLYAHKAEHWIEKVRAACAKNGIDHILLTDDMTLEEAVFSRFRKGGVIR